MALELIERNVPTDLTVTFLVGETPTDPTGNAATVVVKRGDGTVLQASTAATRVDAGKYKFALPAQTAVDDLTAEWTGTFTGLARTVRTHAKVIGEQYVSLAEVRALEGLGDVAKFTPDELSWARAAAIGLLERHTGRAWVPTYAIEFADGPGDTELLLTKHLPVRSVLLVRGAGPNADGFGGSAITGVDWRAYRDGTVYGYGTDYSFAAGRRNFVVQYEHGEDYPPEDLRFALKTHIRHLLVSANSRIPDRATLISTDFGTFNLATAGPNRPTGLPDVDVVYNGYAYGPIPIVV